MFSDQNICLFTGTVREAPKVTEVKDGFYLRFMLCVNSSYKYGYVYKKKKTWVNIQQKFKKNPIRVVEFIKKGARIRVTTNLAYNERMEENKVIHNMYFNMSKFAMIKEAIPTEDEVHEAKKKEITEIIEQQSDINGDFEMFDRDDI
jgi:hypothetical protein